MTAVLAQSHEVWGEGMGLDDYPRFNPALKDSDWGRRNYRFLIGRDDSGGLLSSLQLYTLHGVLDARPLRIAGVGALFTPPARRGQGHAAALLERALALAASEGAGVALRWKEHGARPGSEARSLDLFWCALALARRSGKERVEGWFLPPAPEAGRAYYPIARRGRAVPSVIWRALDPAIELPRLTDEEECRGFELDSF